jgi:hypothetical protein
LRIVRTASFARVTWSRMRMRKSCWATRSALVAVDRGSFFTTKVCVCGGRLPTVIFTV